MNTLWKKLFCFPVLFFLAFSCKPPEGVILPDGDGLPIPGKTGEAVLTGEAASGNEDVPEQAESSLGNLENQFGGLAVTAYLDKMDAMILQFETALKEGRIQEEEAQISATIQRLNEEAKILQVNRMEWDRFQSVLRKKQERMAGVAQTYGYEDKKKEDSIPEENRTPLNSN